MLFFQSPSKTIYLQGVDLPMVTDGDARFRKRFPKFPVEEGYDLTDTAIAEPRRATLNVIAPRAGRSNQARQAADRLRGLQDSNQLLTVIMPTAVLTNMAISDISIKHDRRTGRDLHCSVSLEEIRQGVLAQVATIPGRGANVPAISKANVNESYVELATPTAITAPMQDIPQDSVFSENDYWNLVIGPSF